MKDMRVKRRAKGKKSLRPGEAENEKMECNESKMFDFIFWLNYAYITRGKTRYIYGPKYCLKLLVTTCF